jgi:periplasmic copper chaperone A
MTAVFGTFSTTGSAPVTVVSAQTSASPRTELHEVVIGADGAMVMRPKADGFAIDPGTPHVLAPGGDHIMVMDLAGPIRPGDQVEVTLALSDGSTTRFTALAKETSGGEENYDEGPADIHAPAGQGG